jgi:hypothetical protein
MKTIKWLTISGWLALLGATLGAGAGVGFFIATFAISNPTSLVWIGPVVGGAFLGAFTLAVIPLAVAAWFLFLTMLSQASDAIRYGCKP